MRRPPASGTDLKHILVTRCATKLFLETKVWPQLVQTMEAMAGGVLVSWCRLIAG